MKIPNSVDATDHGKKLWEQFECPEALLIDEQAALFDFNNLAKQGYIEVTELATFRRRVIDRCFAKVGKAIKDDDLLA